MTRFTSLKNLYETYESQEGERENEHDLFFSLYVDEVTRYLADDLDVRFISGFVPSIESGISVVATGRMSTHEYRQYVVDKLKNKLETDGWIDCAVVESLHWAICGYIRGETPIIRFHELEHDIARHGL